MAETKIEWAKKVWNPVTGCTKVSAGCDNCYAEKLALRLQGMSQAKYKNGFSVTCHEDCLGDPLKWKKPQRIFVNSMGDLFHKYVPDDFIDKVFAVMALASQHTFLILTKRPERMLRFMEMANWAHRMNTITDTYIRRLESPLYDEVLPPLPNVHLGVSVEDQKTADERIPLLLKTPAAKRFISIEPMIGAVNIRPYLPHKFNREPHCLWCESCIPDQGNSDFWRQTRWGNHGPFLDGVILGGENGPGARPMHPNWVRKIHDDCAATGVPFFFKGWGQWSPNCFCNTKQAHATTPRPEPGSMGVMFKCGKKNREFSLLDGVEHRELID